MNNRQPMARHLSEVDPEIYRAIQQERDRQNTRLELIAERKVRRRQLTDDGNIEITGRDLREKTPPVGQGTLFISAP